MKPKVWNVSDPNLPKDAVFTGRPSEYGNPYIIGVHGNRSQVIAQHKAHLDSHPELVAKIKCELKGRHLACFCKPKDCHGDYLLAIANTKSIFT
jgi:hypothetical protein